jgi:Flp pilus assembly protein TadG
MPWRAERFIGEAAEPKPQSAFVPRRRNPNLMKGQAILESALVAVLFFLLVFGLLDFGRVFYVQMTLENAVREAGRFASTGNHLPDPQHQGQNLSRVNSIIQIATQAALGTSVSNIQIISQQGGKGDPGGPGDTVTVSLTTNLKLITPLIASFFPGGQYTFTSSVSFKNEPFPPSQTY